MANRIGADVTEVGKAFLALSASTRGTAVEGEPTRAVFEAVATAMGKAGKSSAETSLALQALSQMASKNTVQMEELRGQLGEALPGALQAAAKGMGITTAELIKLVEEGRITAEDIFPALTRGLNELYGGAAGAQTLAQEITNIKNAFTDMSNDIGEAGGLDALKWGAEVAQTALTFLNATVVTVGKSIGVTLAAITSWDFSGLKQSLADIEKEANDKLLKAAQHNGVMRDTLKAVGDEALRTAVANQEAGNAAASAGAAAGQASDNWIRLSNGYRMVIDDILMQTKAQEKSVIARNAEGKAAVELAAAFGTEQQQRVAAANAAVANSDALQKMAQLRLTELETLKAQLESLKQEAKASGQASEERLKQIAELEKTIALRQQDADKAVAQAQGARLAAEVAKAEAEAYRDNSKRVGEYRTALLDALDALQKVRDAKERGKATTEQVTQAELAAGRAALLYRDALNDQQVAIRAKLDAEQAGIDLQRLTVQLAISQQQAAYELAKARGDEKSAIAAKNEITKLEIQLLELSAEAKRAEAKATLAGVEAKRAELAATNQLTEAKSLELEALTKSAQAKELEAKIADTTAQKLRELQLAASSAGTTIDKLGQQTRNAAENTKGAGESMAGGWNGVTSSINGASRAVQEYNQLVAQKYGRPGEGDQNMYAPGRRSSRGEELGEGVQEVGSGGYQFRNKDGMTSDARGQVQQQFVWTQSTIVDYLKQSGLDERIAVDLSKQFLNSNGDVNYEASDAQIRWGGKFSTLASALGKMSEYYRYGDGNQEYEHMVARKDAATKSKSTTSSKTGSSGTESTASTSSGRSTSVGLSTGNTYVSNITLNGKTTSVKFADAASQSSTEQLLRDLSDGKGVSQ